MNRIVSVLRYARKTAARVRRAIRAARTLVFSRGMCVVILLALTLSLFAAAAVVERTKTLLSQGDAVFVVTQTHSQAWRELEKQPWRAVYSGLVPEDERMLREALAQHDALALLRLSSSENDRLASYAATVLGRMTIEAAISQKNPELVKAALGFFVQAADRDKDNEDAKYDLELLLTLLRDRSELVGDGDESGQEGEGDDEGEGGGAGRGPLRGGY